MVFYYWMLDVCECYEELQRNKVSKKFKDCLKLNTDKSLLVESLWLLDHQLYKVIWSGRNHYYFFFIFLIFIKFFTE